MKISKNMVKNCSKKWWKCAKKFSKIVKK